MNLLAAEARIEVALISMKNKADESVFNEWAIVSKEAIGWKLHRYGGTRKNDFLSEFDNDLASLRNTLDPSNSSIGDFAFSHEGFGSGFDAHICIGVNSFILLNNTAKSTGEITTNPKWTSAQIHFSELLEAFISDPLRI